MHSLMINKSRVGLMLEAEREVEDGKHYVLIVEYRTLGDYKGRYYLSLP